jgi:hypothetical protein
MNDLSVFDGDAERDRQIFDLRIKGKTEVEGLGARCLTFTGRRKRR